MNLQRALEESLRCIIEESAFRALNAGALTFVEVPEYSLEVPKHKAHGDYATNIALLLPRQAKKQPRQIAEILVHYANFRGTHVQEMEIAGPGFINFHLHPQWMLPVLPLIEKLNRQYGHSSIGHGKKVLVEFVSANPTRPMHMGNARGAAIGDTLANILLVTGHNVKREFYINDIGNQIDVLGRSLEARYLLGLGQSVDFPEEGYQGKDVLAHAQRYTKRHGRRLWQAGTKERQKELAQFALQENITRLQEDCALFGIHFDTWFSEASLHHNGKVEETIELLTKKGLTYEREQALWLKTTALGEEKDEVLVHSNGSPTYLAVDIAYHKDKFDRGFESLINIWGADHLGHVECLQQALAMLGKCSHALKIIIIQLVSLTQSGEVVRMSKRKGEMITLRELVGEVGRDAARFFFVLRSADSHLDFDLDLAVQQSRDNPVYNVQYAHARIHSMLHQEVDFDIESAWLGDLSVLREAYELELLRKLSEAPQVIERAALRYEPHHLPHYLLDLVSVFYGFYTQCRVRVDDPDLRQARLRLINGTRIVLRNLLEIMGVQAPKQM